MDEKVMVNDILAGVKSDLTAYQTAISEAENMQLRQAFQQIRNNDERIIFFKELNRILKSNGKIIVTEHLQDLPNFLAYNIGFFHFHSKRTWLKTFSRADFKVINEIKITQITKGRKIRKYSEKELYNSFNL